MKKIIFNIIMVIIVWLTAIIICNAQTGKHSIAYPDSAYIVSRNIMIADTISGYQNKQYTKQWSTVKKARYYSFGKYYWLYAFYTNEESMSKETKTKCQYILDEATRMGYMNIESAEDVNTQLDLSDSKWIEVIW